MSSSSKKRKMTGQSAYPNKRSYGDQRNQSKSNPANGQFNALPGLDDSDVEFEDELSREAMMYLRGVRSEAAAIPSLLSAPRTRHLNQSAVSTPSRSTEQDTGHEEGELSEEGEIEEDEVEYNEDYYDYNDDEDNAAPEGYYADGVYYAAPPIGPDRPPPEYMAGHIGDDDRPKMLDAQDAFHAAMRERFRSHRALLREKAFTDSARPDTIHNLLRFDPRLRYMSVLEYDEIFRLLDAATRHLNRGQKGGFSILQCRRLSAWMWSLLAKVEELGTLSSEEVGQVRELGKGAVEVLRKRLMKEEDISEANDEESMSGVDAPSDLGDAQNPESSAHDDSEMDVAMTQNEDDEDGGTSLEESTREVDEEASAERRGYIWCSNCQRAFETKIKYNDHFLGVQHLKAASARKAQLGELREPVSAITQERLVPKPDTTTLEEDATERVKQVDAMLDMVLTIVGEEFGQKDLLAARDAIWDPPQMS